MMMAKFMFVFVIFGCSYAISKEDNGVVVFDNTSEEAHFSISGNVVLDGCDSIALYFYPYFVPMSKNAFQRIIVPVKNGKFQYLHFKKRYSKKFFNFLINPIVQGNEIYTLDNRNLFLASYEDSLVAEIGNGELINFSGRGASKYSIKLMLEQISGQFDFRGTINQMVGGNDGLVKLRRLEAFNDSIYTERLKLIGDFRGSLQKDEYEILKIDAFADRECMFLRTFSLLAHTLNNRDSVILTNYITYFEERYRGVELKSDYPDLYAFSQKYSEYLFDLSLLRMALQKGAGQYTDFPSGGDVYRFLKTQFSGLLRDKMLATCVYRYDAIIANNELFKKAVIDIQDTTLKRLVSDKLKATASGSKMIDFSLTDIRGETVSLEDLRGKVILFDFWYTGCGACASLSKQLEPLLDSLSKEEDFQFVSISIDRDMEMWLKSLKSGKYSHDSALNLFTNGEGSDLLLLRHLDILTYPRLILLDENKQIVVANIRPSAKVVGKLIFDQLSSVR